jgi:hypothetical protein
LRRAIEQRHDGFVWHGRFKVFVQLLEIVHPETGKERGQRQLGKRDEASAALRRRFEQ